MSPITVGIISTIKNSFTGTLESFNFADETTPYPISLDYAICIRKSAGFCGVSVNAFTVGDALGLNANSADPTKFFDEGCSRATAATDTYFNADYIAVLGGNTVRLADHTIHNFTVNIIELFVFLHSLGFLIAGSHWSRSYGGRPILWRL